MYNNIDIYAQAYKQYEKIECIKWTKEIFYYDEKVENLCTNATCSAQSCLQGLIKGA